MRRSFLDSVLRGAEALAARDGVGTVPDTELVGRFAAARDPAAFAVLVRRHGPLVWAVCRNLLPADADAEDAFQATFLALVRSAGSIRRTEALAGWLHGVAYRVAVKARRAAARRRQREAKAAIPEPSSPVPDAAWDKLQAAVHEEVYKLPDRLRLPFVLCELQGRPQKEVAAALHWKAASVSSRLSEARRVLLDRLARRGVPAAMAAGVAVVGGVVGQAAVPASIRVRVLKVAGSPAAVPSNVLSLARGVSPMYLTRTKMLAAGIVVAGLLTTGAGLLSRADAQPPSPANRYGDAVRAYEEALRVSPDRRDRWEYRFIPMDKPLTTTDLQKVLAGADREGWSYCGSQELSNEKSGKVMAHMVFKRPSAGGTVGANDRADGAAALLAELTEREALSRKKTEAADRVRRMEHEWALKSADEKAAAEKAARDAAARERDAANAERHRAEEALKQLGRVKAADADRAAADKARDKEIEEMRAKYEALIAQLRDELKKATDMSRKPVPPKK